MATAKRKPATKKADTRKEPNEKDPLSWLYTNPEASSDGFVFGVLRKTFMTRKNSAHEFGWRKAHLGPDFANSDRSEWHPNAERVEVVLPPKADDMLSNPSSLLQQVDEFAAPTEASLLTYLTLPLSDAERIHVGWECARSFAVTLANERSLASVVILHSPGSIGSPFALHAHMLLVPRRLTGLGLRHGSFDQELIHDCGQAILAQMWNDHRGRGG